LNDPNVRDITAAMPRLGRKQESPRATPRHEIFGASIERRDGPQKLTGRAVYVDDLPMPPGGLHVRTVRSRIAHGRIKSIRFGEGVDWSRVHVIDHKKVPGPNVIRLLIDDQPALASDVVRHREEPILLLAAEDKELLERAVRAVHIDYEEWPAAFTIADARARKAKVFGDDNVFKRFHIQRGEGRAALAKAHRVVRGTYTTPAQEHVYIEPQGMIAHYEGDTLVVRGSMQCPYYVHSALTNMFAKPAGQVRIVQTETGGGFGGKEDFPSIIAGHAAVVAHATGRPARLIYDREEDLASTTKRHPAEVTIESGFDADGRLVAMNIDVAMNGGAYCTLSPVVLSRGVIHAAGAYDCPNVEITGAAYATNLVPFGAFRGFGAPQTLFAIEAHMDECAAALGLDQVAIRRLNLMDKGAVTATGQALGEDTAARETMGLALALSDWDRRRAAHARHNRTSAKTRRGLGLSVVLHGSGFTGNGEKKLASRARVDTLPDGRLRCLASNTEMGQGTQTVFAQIVAEAVGVTMDDVLVAQPDTAIVPDSGPTVASRSVMVVGALLKQAAEQLRDDLETRLGKPLRTRASLLAAIRAEHARGSVPSAGTQYSPPPGIVWNDETYVGAAYGSYAWMSSVAEVEVDLVTCEVKLLHMWLVPEVGRVVNPVLARGQIEGGAAQAAGWALLEDCVWRDGAMANNTLTNYILPTSADAPRMQVEFLEKDCIYGPFGAKGLGELPMDGPAGAIVAALRDAIGVVCRDLPASPERIHAMLAEKDLWTPDFWAQTAGGAR
jgi:CO/xanthine dehydrogenase Mo-binding subunit